MGCFQNLAICSLGRFFGSCFFFQEHEIFLGRHFEGVFCLLDGISGGTGLLFSYLHQKVLAEGVELVGGFFEGLQFLHEGGFVELNVFPLLQDEVLADLLGVFALLLVDV